MIEAIPHQEKLDVPDLTRSVQRITMKVIKAFGNENSYYALPPYDGSHAGNIKAWMVAIGGLRTTDRKLYRELLAKVADFGQTRSNELGIVSILLRKDLECDVRVTWRRRDVTLKMYSLKSRESDNRINMVIGG